jgi:hypothetical protein
LKHDQLKSRRNQNNNEYQEEGEILDDPVIPYDEADYYQYKKRHYYDEALDYDFRQDDRPEGDVYKDGRQAWSSSRRRQSMSPDEPFARRNSSSLPRRRPGRSRDRSGTPPLSDAVKDLYDRFFRYGMGDEEAMGDFPKGYSRDSFGGTRGKSAAYRYPDGRYYDVMGSPWRRQRRLDNEDIDDDVSYSEREQLGSGSHRSRATRGSRNRAAEKEVSGWFNDDVMEGYDEYEDYDDIDDQEDWVEPSRQARRRRRRYNEPSNPIVDFLDNLLDVDKDEMRTKAELYDESLGRKSRSKQSRSRSQVDYGDRYDEETEVAEGGTDGGGFNRGVDNDDYIDVEIEDKDINTQTDADVPVNRFSWEERVRRLERVPPAGIAAWGPSGDLGIDARSKAMLDAMEELRLARSKVEAKEDQRRLAREDIVVLRADLSLEMKRRETDPRRGRGRIRQIQFDLDDASRILRRAQLEEATAREQLQELQDKHWAILSLYDADKASRIVDESLRDFPPSAEERQRDINAD